jgi:hypothetical protein
MSYVVVIFGTSDSDRCDVSPCPIRSFGPFATGLEAAAFAERLPAWQQPHTLSVDSPSTAVFDTPAEDGQAD